MCEKTNLTWFVLWVRKLAKSIINWKINCELDGTGQLLGKSLKGHFWTPFFTRTRHNANFKRVSYGNFQDSDQTQKGDIQYSVFFGFISLLLEGLQENAHRIHCSGKCQENSKTATPLRHFAKIA